MIGSSLAPIQSGLRGIQENLGDKDDDTLLLLYFPSVNLPSPKDRKQGSDLRLMVHGQG